MEIEIEASPRLARRLVQLQKRSKHLRKPQVSQYDGPNDSSSEDGDFDDDDDDDNNDDEEEKEEGEDEGEEEVSACISRTLCNYVQLMITVL